MLPLLLCIHLELVTVKVATLHKVAVYIVKVEKVRLHGKNVCDVIIAHMT